MTADHRWAAGSRLGVLYGLRRSEVLALHWDDLDVVAKTLRIDQSLVAVAKGASWSDAKNERSRRRIPLDDETLRVLKRRRGGQATERLLAGAAWQEHDLIIATRQGQLVLLGPTTARSRWRSTRPAPRDSRRTACGTQRRRRYGRRRDRQRPAARDRRHPRHSADMLMKTYAHAMPASTSAVVQGIAQRSAP